MNLVNLKFNEIKEEVGQSFIRIYGWKFILNCIHCQVATSLRCVRAAKATLDRIACQGMSSTPEIFCDWEGQGRRLFPPIALPGARCVFCRLKDLLLYETSSWGISRPFFRSRGVTEEAKRKGHESTRSGFLQV